MKCIAGDASMSILLHCQTFLVELQSHMLTFFLSGTPAIIVWLNYYAIMQSFYYYLSGWGSLSIFVGCKTVYEGRSWFVQKLLLLCACMWATRAFHWLVLSQPVLHECRSHNVWNRQQGNIRKHYIIVCASFFSTYNNNGTSLIMFTCIPSGNCMTTCQK